MKNQLFIGGPKDGETIAISPERNEVLVDVVPMAYVECQISGCNPAPDVRIVSHAYRRIWLAPDLSVFLHESIPDENLMCTLVEGYAAKGANCP